MNSTDRKLAALLFSDIKGYSSQMDRDEEGALRKLAIHNAIFDRQVDAHGGRTIKTVGDAYMVEFPSAVNAVRCGLDVQRELETHNGSKVDEDQIWVRMGIHFGDVIIKGDDLFGETVNIAARLEPKAPPGSICVSQSVFNQVRRKCEAWAKDLGLVELKNIKEPFQLYALFPSKDTLDLVSDEVVTATPPPTSSRSSLGMLGGLVGSLALIGSVVVALILSGDGPPDTPDPGPAPLATSDASEANAEADPGAGAKPTALSASPRRGGVLRLGVEGQRTAMYDLTTRVSSVNYEVLSVVYDTLLRYDPEADALVPGVVERWTTSADATQLTVYLRDGVWFHPHRCLPEGKPRQATAADLVFSIERGSRDRSLPLKGLDPFLSGKADRIEGLTLTDDGGVALTLSRPSAWAINNIAINRFLPRELKTCPGIDLTSIAQPPGSGPFMVDAAKPGFHFSLKRWERYWDRASDGQPFPYLDGIDISVVRDTVTSVSRLAKGTLDVVEIPEDVAATVLDGLTTDRPALKSRFPRAELNIAAEYPPTNRRVLQAVFFLPGEGRPQLQLEVRKAIAAALDVEKLAPKFSGMSMATRFLDAEMEGYDEGLRAPRHDLAKAKKLLSGAKLSEKVSDFSFGHYKELQAVAQMFREQLAKAGIKVRLVRLSPSAMNSAIRSRSVDAFLARWRSPTTNQEPYPFLHGLTSLLGKVGWTDPLLTEMGQSLMSEPKRAERAKLYRKLEAHLIERSYILPLARPAERAPMSFWLARPSLQGLTDPFSGRVRLTSGTLLQHVWLAP